MSVEHAPDGRRGYYASWMTAAAPVGVALATGAFAALSVLSDEQFLAWGWRVPFLFSIVLVSVGLFIRLRVFETPAFARVREAGTQARMPVVEALREHPKNVALAAGVNLGFNAFIFVLFTFMLSYATAQLGVERSLVLNATLAGSAVQIAAVLVFSALSDRVGRRPVMLAGAAFLALYAFPLFWLVNTGNATPDLAGPNGRVLGLVGHLRPYGRLCLRVVRREGTLQWGFPGLPDGGRAGGRPLAVHRHRAARVVQRRIVVGFGVPGPWGRGEFCVRLSTERGSGASYPGSGP
jgi:MFS family permease